MRCVYEESARERWAVVARAESTHEITDKRGTETRRQSARARRERRSTLAAGSLPLGSTTSPAVVELSSARRRSPPSPAARIVHPLPPSLPFLPPRLRSRVPHYRGRKPSGVVTLSELPAPRAESPRRRRARTLLSARGRFRADCRRGRATDGGGRAPRRHPSSSKRESERERDEGRGAGRPPRPSPASSPTRLPLPLALALWSRPGAIARVGTRVPEARTPPGSLEQCTLRCNALSSLPDSASARFGGFPSARRGEEEEEVTRRQAGGSVMTDSGDNRGAIQGQIRCPRCRGRVEEGGGRGCLRPRETRSWNFDLRMKTRLPAILDSHEGQLSTSD